MTVASDSKAPSENTPLQGEHFPGSRGPDLARWQLFGPIVAALVLVGGAYAWALRSRARRGKVDLDLPVDVDRPKALEFLTELKDDVDRAPIDARLDLEHHTVAKETPGYLLRVYDSMVAVEYAARSGAARVDLAAGLSWPKV